MLNPPVSPSSAFEVARLRAVKLLTDAYAYDVISDAEFERRLDMLGGVTSASAIDSVVADLAAAPTPGHAIAPGIRRLLVEEKRIIAFMSETARKGPWRVPARLNVRAVMSDVKIDLRYAVIAEGCIISVRAIMANVKIIVAPGVTVDFRVDPLMASVGNDAGEGGYGVSGPTHIHVMGTALMSEVKVRVREYP